MECGLLSPWLSAFETSAGGDAARSQKTWVLASLRGGGHGTSEPWLGLEGALLRL